MKGIKMKRGRKGRVNRLLVALIAVMMVAVYGLAPVQPVTGVAFAEEAWYTMDAYGNVVVKDGTTTIDTTLQCEYKVTTVTIPASVTEVEDYAFFGCENLTVVTFKGETPPSIGSCAFESQGDAVTVNVPKGCKDEYESALVENYAFAMTDYTVVEAGGGTDPVDPVDPTPAEKELFTYSAVEGGVAITGLGKEFAVKGTADGIIALPEGAKVQLTGAGQNQDSAFSMCSSVQGYDISNDEFKTDKDGVIFTADGKTLVQYPLGRTTSSYDIPEGTETIGQNAFKWHQSDTKNPNNLKTVTFPNSLKTVEKNAFMCQGLTSVTIPASVKSIGDRAFYRSKALESINIEDGKTALDLGKYTFNHCTKLNNVKIPARVTKLDDGIFSCCYNLKNIETKAVAELGNSVFVSSGLEKINMPDTITKMGNATFFECSGLTEVTLPANLEELGTCTFEVCSSLTKVIIPDTVKFSVIPEDTFWACSSLKSLTFPESITETKACAFSNCRNLESIEVKNLKKDFKRSDFDCYAINLDGDYSKYRYWGEGVFYLYDDATISDIAGDQDNSGGAIGELEKVNNEGEELDAAASGATLATADAGSIELLCRCSVGGGGQFAATANPKFNYKTASSNTATSGGSATGNAAKAAGGNGGSPVTGDEASLLIFALLAMVSGTYIFARRQKVK